MNTICCLHDNTDLPAVQYSSLVHNEAINNSNYITACKLCLIVFVHPIIISELSAVLVNACNFNSISVTCLNTHYVGLRDSRHFLKHLILFAFPPKYIYMYIYITAYIQICIYIVNMHSSGFTHKE